MVRANITQGNTLKEVEKSSSASSDIILNS